MKIKLEAEAPWHDENSGSHFYAHKVNWKQRPRFSEHRGRSWTHYGFATNDEGTFREEITLDVAWGNWAYFMLEESLYKFDIDHPIETYLTNGICPKGIYRRGRCKMKHIEVK